MPPCTRNPHFRVIDVATGTDLAHPAFPDTDWNATLGTGMSWVVEIVFYNDGTSAGGATKDLYVIVSWD